MYEKAARTGNLLYRATTLGGTALTLILFLWKGCLLYTSRCV